MEFKGLTAEQVRSYEGDGYIIIKSLFDREEIGLLLKKARSDPDFSDALVRRDEKGNVTRLKLWNHPPDNLYGLFPRCERMVGIAERLLGGEVYHYHSKMNLKEPRTGGAWEWHQDYGYWYNNAVLYPLLVSIMIGLDPATRENGCLTVLKGTHRIGRINHLKLPGGQTGADLERVEQAKRRHETVYVELDPGDVVVFHCNLLHASAANESEKPRWTLICCYNAARNNPYREIEHPCYTPLVKVANEAIKSAGQRELGLA